MLHLCNACILISVTLMFHEGNRGQEGNFSQEK